MVQANRIRCEWSNVYSGMILWNILESENKSKRSNITKNGNCRVFDLSPANTREKLSFVYLYICKVIYKICTTLISYVIQNN